MSYSIIPTWRLNRLLPILTLLEPQRQGGLWVVSTRSRCNTLSLGSKLIISSLHTGPSCQPPRSRICLHQCNQSMQSINQASINPRIRAHQSINSIQRVRNIQSIKLGLIDWLIASLVFGFWFPSAKSDLIRLNGGFGTILFMAPRSHTEPSVS